MGVEMTPRTRYLRTLLSEYSRVCDHLTCIAASLMELGAMTPFLYLVMVRDYMYEHLAALTGARVTYTYGRVGGLASDLTTGGSRAWPRSSRSTRTCRPRARLIGPQPHLHRPHEGRGVHLHRDAIDLGITGPSCARPALRATCARTRHTSPTPSSTSTSPWASGRQLRPLLRAHASRWTNRST